MLEAGLQHGVHLVVEVNMLNPSARIQPGDEIVQVNYQTVVGWQTKKVLLVVTFKNFNSFYHDNYVFTLELKSLTQGCGSGSVSLLDPDPGGKILKMLNLDLA